MPLERGPEIARRLVTIRSLHYGDDQSEFARSLGINASTWKNFERGNTPLSLDVACLLVERFELSLDWLFYGHTGDMKREVLFKLERVASHGRAFFGLATKGGGV